MDEMQDGGKTESGERERKRQIRTPTGSMCSKESAPNVGEEGWDQTAGTASGPAMLRSENAGRQGADVATA